MEEDEMGKACSTLERWKMCNIFWLEDLKGRDHLVEDIGMEVGGMVWTACFCLRIGISGEPL